MIKDLYVRKLSPVHNLNFWTKFACLLLILPLSIFLTDLIFLPIFIIGFGTLFMISRIPLRTFWNATRIYYVAIFISMSILSLIFHQGSTMDGLTNGLTLSTRFGLLVSFGILFAMTTNPIEIPTAFMWVRIPHRFGITLMVGLRMFPLLSQKVQNIVDAQRARGAKIEFSVSNLPRLPFQLVPLLVPMFHSTLEVAVRLSDTLISRGYNPKGKITVPVYRFGKIDYCMFILSAILLFCVILLQP